MNQQKHSILNSKIKESFQNLSGKNIFISGGTGFFGKSFLDLFIKHAQNFNIQLTILSRSPEDFLRSHSKYNHPNIQWIKGDITDFEFPKHNFEIILHFATPADAKLNIEQPDVMAQIITHGMIHILDFAKACGCKNFLFASSGAVYGPQPSEITHIPESYVGAPNPASADAAYGEAKRYAELLGCIAARKNNFKFKIARCFTFIGTHLNQNGLFAIANFIKDAKNNTTIDIKGDGTTYRSYLYADDLVVWLLTILNKGTNFEIYNVGSDLDLTIADLARAVQKVINPDVKIKIHQQPESGAKPTKYVPSVNKARTELELDVWTSLAEAIQKSKI